MKPKSLRLRAGLLSLLSVGLLAGCSSSSVHTAPIKTTSAAPVIVPIPPHKAIPLRYKAPLPRSGVTVTRLPAGIKQGRNTITGVTTPLRIGKKYSLNFVVMDGAPKGTKGNYGVTTLAKQGTLSCPAIFLATPPHVYTFRCSFVPRGKSGQVAIWLVDPATGRFAHDSTFVAFRAK